MGPVPERTWAKSWTLSLAVMVVVVQLAKNSGSDMVNAV